MTSNTSTKNFASILKTLGPGLLFAGAAVGVSHLVQSTRAGAEYGFALVWAVILANIFKYPFYEFGPRYAAATGESLIEGYYKQGKWVIAIFLFMTLGTMFTIQAAVTVVTAGLAINLSAWGDPLTWSAIILTVCALILLFGRYSVLDKVIKVIIVILTLSTLMALLSVLFSGDSNTAAVIENPFEWDSRHILFLIALMGWMPAPIDISVWHSIWALEKKKLNEGEMNLKSALFDFNVGFIGTGFLALAFLTLGALVMYGSGESFSPKGAVFAGQLINLYTSSLGEWARPVISIAALTTMFSTTLTCLDAFPRVLSRTVITIFPEYKEKHSNSLYWFWSIITILGSLGLLAFLSGQMRTLVDFATILSFLTAPILAIMNYRLVSSQWMPEAARPKAWLKVLSLLGIVFLLAFCALFFVYWF